MRPSSVLLVSCALMTAQLWAPARAHAQAEPAPPEYVPPGHEKPPPPPSPYKWHVMVDAGMVTPLGARPSTLPPVGWGAGIQISRALVELGRLRFGLGASFAYRRVQDNVKSTIPFGDIQQFESNMSFAGLLVLDGIFGRVHPWLAAGAGVDVAQFHSPAMNPGDMTTDIQNVVPLIQLALGVDVEVYKRVEIGLAGELDPTFSATTTGTPPRTPFSPGYFVLRLGVGFRF